MAGYVYETHNMQNPLLPFIFHQSFIVTQRNSLPNWHENIELLQCIGGKGYIRCGPDTYSFSEGDIFVVNANTPHSICSNGSVIYRCLIIDNSFGIANGLPLPSLHFESTVRCDDLNTQFDRVTAAFQAYSDTNLCAVADIRYAVLGLLKMLCRDHIAAQPREANSAADIHVKNAITYIRQNLASPITLDAIAQNIGVSKYHLSREFKNFTGKTIIQTVNLIRCTEARQQIETGSSVSAAAAACGFDSLSYFSKTFKKLMGRLPSDCLPGIRSDSVSLHTPDYAEDICY